MSKPHAIIIGAGFTGTATAHELALRGFHVSVVERGNFVSGTSGRTHGLLHSGARYCVHDQESAIECIQENKILRKIVPQVIEPNGGLFVAFDEEDLAYEQSWIQGASECGIPFDELSQSKTLELEPNLNPKLIKAYFVPDATFDPLRLALAFAATAKSNGAKFYLYHEVESLIQDGQGNVIGVKTWDRTTNQKKEFHGDIVINATGAWVGEIAAMVGGHVPIQPVPGIMVAFNKRLMNRTINRLRQASDGDIFLPQRRMSIIGTTSYTVEELDYVPVIESQIQQMLACATEMVPTVKEAKIRGVFTATRPLIGNIKAGRSLSRTFKCFDHKETDNIDGFVTITGGKATTCRAMAEQTADIVCKKLGVSTTISSREIPLLSYRQYYMM